MAILQKQVSYAKELDDVLVAAVSLLQQIRDKKSIPDIITTEFQAVVDAVNGIGDVKNELAADRKVCLETIGYRIGDIVDAIL